VVGWCGYILITENEKQKKKKKNGGNAYTLGHNGNNQVPRLYS